MLKHITLAFSLLISPLCIAMEDKDINREILKIIKKENPRKSDRSNLEKLLAQLPKDQDSQHYTKTFCRIVSDDVKDLELKALEYPNRNHTLVGQGIMEGFGALALFRAAVEHEQSYTLVSEVLMNSKNCPGSPADFVSLRNNYFTLLFLPYGYINELAHSCDIRFIAALSCIVGAGVFAYKSFTDTKKGLRFNRTITAELDKKKMLLGLLQTHRGSQKEEEVISTSNNPFAPTATFYPAVYPPSYPKQ